MLLSRLLHQYLFNGRAQETADPIAEGDTMQTTDRPQERDEATAPSSVAVNNLVQFGTAGGSGNHFTVTNNNRTTFNSAHTHHHYGNIADTQSITAPSITAPAQLPAKESANATTDAVNTNPTQNKPDSGGYTNPTQNKPPPQKKKVVPLKGVYNTEGACIVMPHELMPPYPNQITEDLCEEYFECYAHFYTHGKCNQEVRKLVESKGGPEKALEAVVSTPARIRNFQDILQSVHAGILAEGKRLFMDEVKDRFGQHGIKVKGSGQAPASFEDCKAIIRSGNIARQLKIMEYPQIYPAILAYKCVHGITARSGDEFHPKFNEALLTYGRRQVPPFTFLEEVKYDDDRQKRSHNVINVAKRGFGDPKTSFGNAVKKGLGVAIKSNVCVPGKDQLLIPIRTFAPEVKEMDHGDEEEGGKKKKKKKTTSAKGPYFLIEKSRFNLSSFNDEEAIKMLRKDTASRTLIEAAKTSKAQGLNKADAMSRFSRAFDQLNGIVGAAPLNTDQYYFEDPSRQAPQVPQAQVALADPAANQPGKDLLQAPLSASPGDSSVSGVNAAIRQLLGDGDLFDGLPPYHSPPKKQQHMYGAVHGQQNVLSTGHQGYQGNGQQTHPYPSFSEKMGDMRRASLQGIDPLLHDVTTTQQQQSHMYEQNSLPTGHNNNQGYKGNGQRRNVVTFSRNQRGVPTQAPKASLLGQEDDLPYADQQDPTRKMASGDHQVNQSRGKQLIATQGVTADDHQANQSGPNGGELEPEPGAGAVDASSLLGQNMQNAAQQLSCGKGMQVLEAAVGAAAGVGESGAGGQVLEDTSQLSRHDQGKPRTWYAHFHDNMQVSQGRALHHRPPKPLAPIHMDAFLCPHCESAFFSSEQARQAHITGDCADAPQAQGGGGTLQETLEFYKTCDKVLQVNQASSVAPPEHASTGDLIGDLMGARPTLTSRGVDRGGHQNKSASEARVNVNGNGMSNKVSVCLCYKYHSLFDSIMLPIFHSGSSLMGVDKMLLHQ